MLLSINDNRSMMDIVEGMFHCPECNGEIMVIPTSIGVEGAIYINYVWRCLDKECKYHAKWQSEPALVGW